MTERTIIPGLAFAPKRGFGVYAHWPYCTRICPYCDFNVYAAKSRDVAPLLAALRRDLEIWRDWSGPRAVDSVFFGGGTPSLIPPREIAGLIEHVDRLWGLAPNAEISLEANPHERGRFTDFAAAGVGRLSLGVQSLNDATLRFLGRDHDAAAAMAAVEAARGLFASLSIDLIYALPGQTPADWRAELDAALALAPDHLSPYELSIEPGAAFAYAVRRGDWTPADEDAAADLYELTQAMCDAAGLPAYEISNHARALEHQSRHNRIYWASGDWAGVGPGAHGRLTLTGRRLAVEAERRPADYVARVERGARPPIEDLSALDVARERVAMGLRVVEGIAADALADLGLAADAAKREELTQLGLIEPTSDRIALTLRGRLTADAVAAALAP